MDLNKWGIAYIIKPFDGFVAFSIFAISYVLYWIVGYIRIRKVSSLQCLKADSREVRGLPAIHSWIEFFESGARQKIPHIPFFSPVKDFTLEQPYQSEPSPVSWRDCLHYNLLLTW